MSMKGLEIQQQEKTRFLWTFLPAVTIVEVWRLAPPTLPKGKVFVPALLLPHIQNVYVPHQSANNSQDPIPLLCPPAIKAD